MREGLIRPRFRFLEARPTTSCTHRHILLAKLYRKPVDRTRALATVATSPVTTCPPKRASSGRCATEAHPLSPRPSLSLEEIFDALNRRFFHGLLGASTYLEPEPRPQQPRTLRSCHNAIVISRIFDHPASPLCRRIHPLPRNAAPEAPVKLRGVEGACTRKNSCGRKPLPDVDKAKKFLRII